MPSQHRARRIRTVKIPRRLNGLALVASVHVLPIFSCLAQSIAPSAVPTADTGPSTAITFANSKSLTTKAKSSPSDFININPGETVSIDMQFSALFATTRLIVQPLDGGIISTAEQDNAVGTDGRASVQFRAGTQPGLYRLLLNAGGTISTLQFWVTDTTNAAANPPVLKP
jgi:hypothetical protein